MITFGATTLGEVVPCTKPSTLTGVTEFKSGKVYTYTITVKASGLDIVATVEDWAVGGTDTGNAVLQ